MCWFLVAVVFAAGGLNGAFACTDIGAAGTDIHVAAHDHGAHADGLGAHDHDAHEAGALGDPSDGASHVPSGMDCDDCPHMHVHCCASTAVPPGDYGLKLAFSSGLPSAEKGSLLPLGQLFYPLLRPPRAAA